MKPYIFGLSVIIASIIISGSIICSTIACNITLSGVADVSQIVIAIGAIGSIIFSTDALRESDKALALAHVPSVAIRPHQYWSVSAGKEGLQWNVPFSRGDQELITIMIYVQCENLGTGVAFNVKTPKVINASYEGWTPTPLHLTPQSLDAEAEFHFRVSIAKTFKEWISCEAQAAPIRVEVEYTNDQQNVFCTSWWTTTPSILEVADGLLIARENEVRGKGGVDYIYSSSK